MSYWSNSFMVHKGAAVGFRRPSMPPTIENSMTMNTTTLRTRGIRLLLVMACFAAPASAVADQKKPPAKESPGAEATKTKGAGGKSAQARRRSAHEAAQCQESLVGTFRILEKRGEPGVIQPDMGESVKITRQGPAFSAAFIGADAKPIVGYAGQSELTSLTSIAPEAMRRMIFGTEKHPEFEALARALRMCGLGGEGVSILRVADKERTAYTLSAGAGAAAFTATLDKVK